MQLYLELPKREYKVNPACFATQTYIITHYKWSTIWDDLDCSLTSEQTLSPKMWPKLSGSGTQQWINGDMHAFPSDLNHLSCIDIASTQILSSIQWSIQYTTINTKIKKGHQNKVLSNFLYLGENVLWGY